MSGSPLVRPGDRWHPDWRLAATKLTFEAAVIQAGVVISGEADAADYRSAQKTGQELYNALGITDDKWGDDPLR